MHRVNPSTRSGYLVAALFGVIATHLTAAVSAAPPTVKNFFPAGVQRGQSITVIAAGDFSAWPAHVWCDHPDVNVSASQEKGQLQVSVAADATPGLAWLRLYNEEGASALRPLVVGTLAEIVEIEPNDSPAEAKAIDGPRVANGRLQQRGDVDGYIVSLQRGETLVAALTANSHLGSPVDAVLQICELAERKPLDDAQPLLEAFVLEQNHDAVGLDPRIVFTAPREAKYLVRVFGFPSQPDSSIALAGGDEFVYRLTLTTGPYLAAALPLAKQTEQPHEIQHIGWNLPESLRSVTPTSSSVAFHPDAAGYVPLATTSHPVVVANAEQPKSQEVLLPVTISGQLQQAGDRHSFRFPVAKGKPLRLTVAAHELGYPLDPQLTITDDEGKVLLEGDDHDGRADPALVFAPPADGHCRVLIGDVASGGGPTFVYALTIEPEGTDFGLTLANDRFTITADTPLEIPVTIDRRGFAKPITIRALGLPRGIVAEEATSQPTGDSAAAVKLVVRRTPDAIVPLNIAFSIEGVASGEPECRRRAEFDVNVPFGGRHDAVWLTAPR